MLNSLMVLARLLVAFQVSKVVGTNLVSLQWMPVRTPLLRLNMAYSEQIAWIGRFSYGPVMMM